MGTINLGKIKPLYKGDYSGSVTYKVLDFVRYNNSLYVCKLDSIGNLPTNTTYFDNAAYLQTPSEILTSIKTVDGTGSGLDADLLDGLHSSSFMQKISSTDNAIVRFDGTTGAVQNSGVIIDDNNRLLIGTSTAVTGANIQTFDGTIRMIDGYLVAGGAYTGTQTNHPLGFITNDTERMRIDSAGNVGIGTPLAPWHSAYKVLQLSGGSYITFSNMYGQITANSYLNTSGADAYISNGLATMYAQGGGVHSWKTAPSGTAGNPITWTTAMTLGSNGNLLLGTSTDNGVDKLQVNGSISSGTIRQIGGVDLNSFRYRTENIGVWSNVTNKPIDEYGYLEVIVYEVNAWILQRFTCLGAIDSTKAGRTFSRCYINGATWTPWVEK